MAIKTVAPETTFFAGGGRGVILMHAYTGSPNDVRLLGRFLNNHGYAVLMPMLTGHGTTNPEDVLATGVAAWQNDLAESIEFMKNQGFQEIAIFGLSLGGVLAMSAIEEHPEYILGGGPFCSPIIAESKTNIVPSFVHYAQTAMTNAGVSAADQNRRLPAINAQLQAQLNEIKALTTKVYDKLPLIEQPTLLVQAALDKMIDPQDVYTIEKQLTASPTTLNWYPKSGHVITVGVERQQLQEDVLAFLNTLAWQIV